MIKSIRLQNFFGFQDCTINLEKGENVLVGINGSGKSNFFKAIKLLKEAVRGKGIREILFEEFRGFERILFNSNYQMPIMLSYEFDTIDMFEDEGFGLFYELKFTISQNKLDYSVAERFWRDERGISHPYFSNSNGIVSYPTPNVDTMVGKVRSGNEKEPIISDFKNDITDFDELNHLVSSAIVYSSFDLDKIRNGSSPRIENYLLIDGSNLASLLNDLKIKQRSAYKNIIDALKKVNESYVDIHTKQTTSILELWIEEKGLESSIPVINISDGTLCFLCLMAILYNPNRGKVICIDEPELGLHPDMINTLYRAIEYAAETSQVIISTHSAHLLDYFNLENIRVFEKDENNATTVSQYNSEQFESFKNEYMPGQLWRDGHLGGNRW